MKGILNAVEQGAETSAEISALTGLDVSTCSSYLSRLYRSGLIGRASVPERLNNRGNASFRYTPKSKSRPRTIEPAVIWKLRGLMWRATYFRRLADGKIPAPVVRSAKWTALLDVIVRDGGANILVPQSDDSRRFRNQLTAMVSTSRRTLPWRWSIKRFGREVIVRRIGGNFAA